MSRTIPQIYVDLFGKIAVPILNDLDYNLALVCKSDSADIHINLGSRNYLLTFSTHHLDYDFGVVIAESDDEKLHWDKIVLPSLEDREKGNIYYFSGENLESEIRRITHDFLSFDEQKWKQ